MRRLLSGVVLLGALLLIGRYLFFSGPEGPGAYSATAGPPPVVVAVAVVREDVWQPILQATGTLRASQGVEVTAQESGIVTVIHFQSGSRVRKGELLVQQYVEDELVQLKGLQAELELAQKSYDRSFSLIDKRAVSQSQLDTTLSDMERNKALVESLQVSIAKRSIRAPFDGVLGIRQIDVGQYIEPGDYIVVLDALDPIFVEFTLPQANLPAAQIGQPITVSVDAYPGLEFVGRINAIEPRVNPTTRTFKVQAEISNQDQRLRPGMYVATRLILPAREKVLTLPQAAISYDPYGKSVFVVENSAVDAVAKLVVRSSYVTLGETRGDQVSVISGLSAGDLVVTAGQLHLREGASVRIDEHTEVNSSADPQVEDR